MEITCIFAVMQRWLIFIFIPLAIACSDNSNSKKELSKDKMLNVLTDIQLTESANGFYASKNDSAMRKMAGYYAEIFQRNKVTAEQYEHTYNYYLRHPDEMDSLYQELLNRLVAKQSELRGHTMSEKAYLDSLHKHQRTRQKIKIK
jgi:hypothetical protein